LVAMQTTLPRRVRTTREHKKHDWKNISLFV
jgi:hypothetical protein